MKAKRILKAPKSTKSDKLLFEAVEEYHAIQAKLRFYQDLLKGPTAVIREAVENAPDYEIVTPNYKVTYKESSAERIDLKLAKKQLGKALNPFLSTSTWRVLRIN